MNKLSLKTFLCLLSSVGINAFAYDCEVDGIYYNLNETDPIASVTYKSCNNNSYGFIVYNEDYSPTSIAIPSSITVGSVEYKVASIGESAFRGCKSLTSVTIPNSVTSIGANAFYGCSGLTSVIIGNSVTSIGSSAFDGCSGLTSIAIPNGVTDIGESAFHGCSSLTEFSVPNTVTSIGNDAFTACSKLKQFTIEDGESPISLGYDRRYTGNINPLFYKCPIVSLYLGRNMSYYYGSFYSYYTPFYGVETLKELTIGNYVTKIGAHEFQYCSGLTSVKIGNSVATIGDYAFGSCTNLTFVICDSGEPPTSKQAIFPNNVVAIVPPFALSKYQSTTGWTNIQYNTPFVVKSSQTTITLSPCDFVSDTYAEFQGKKYTPNNGEIVITGLSPNKTYQMSTYAQYGNYTLEGTISATTKSPALNIDLVKATNLTLTLKGTHNAGDAKVTEYGFEGNTNVNVLTQEGLTPNRSYAYTYYVVTSDGSRFSTTNWFSTVPVTATATASTNPSQCNLAGDYSIIDATVTGYGFTNYPDQKNVKLTGLDPNRTYTSTFYVDTQEGGRVTKDVQYTTQTLSLTTSQPKVISLGNVIVAAESNLDDEETNVGFEWRRTDWNDDFASNTGGAYIYNGTMEGYIRNLNTEKLWKYRPYYLSNSGTYYYGDWVGLDPTNTSYFEPTVHTYSNINIEGNTALVKGYALTGTDKITVQGFKYWKSVAGAKDREGMNRIASVPSDAMTIEADGQVMTANLTGLDYNSTYHYLAFVTTSEGETYYGEEQMFSTGDDLTGIEGIQEDAAEQQPATVVARYNMNGQAISSPQKGINILRMSDGTVKKVLVK